MKHHLRRKSAISLLLAACLTLCSCGKNKTELAAGENPDSPYPYSWAEKSSGAYEIEFTGELPENSEWTIMNTSPVFSAEQDGKSAKFTVTPESPGYGTLVIRMRESGLPVDVGADFSFRVSVDDNKRMTIENTEAFPTEAESFVSDTGSTVYWKEGRTGGLFIYLGGEGWTVDSAEGVSYFGPTVINAETRTEVIANEGSISAGMTFVNKGSGSGFSLKFGYDGQQLSISDCSSIQVTETEEPVFKGDTPELKALAEAYEAAKTDAEREKIAEQYYAEEDRIEYEARLQARIDLMTFRKGRELTEQEIKKIKEDLSGDN